MPDPNKATKRPPQQMPEQMPEQPPVEQAPPPDQGGSMPQEAVQQAQPVPPEQMPQEPQEPPYDYENEPYGAQLLRKLHEDTCRLMADYDALLTPLDNKAVSKHFTNMLMSMEKALTGIEALWAKEYEALPPIMGSDMGDEGMEDPGMEDPGMEDPGMEDPSMQGDTNMDGVVSEDEINQAIGEGPDDYAQPVDGDYQQMGQGMDMDTGDGEGMPASSGSELQEPTPEEAYAVSQEPQDHMGRKSFKSMCSSCGQSDCVCDINPEGLTAKQQELTLMDCLDDREIGSASEAMSFLEELSAENSLFDEESRMKSYHYYKLLDGMASLKAYGEPPIEDDGPTPKTPDFQVGDTVTSRYGTGRVDNVGARVTVSYPDRRARIAHDHHELRKSLDADGKAIRGLKLPRSRETLNVPDAADAGGPPSYNTAPNPIAPAGAEGPGKKRPRMTLGAMKIRNDYRDRKSGELLGDNDGGTGAAPGHNYPQWMQDMGMAYDPELDGVIELDALDTLDDNDAYWEPDDEYYQNSMDMHPDRKMCKGVSEFFKKLSGERAFGDPHRQEALNYMTKLSKLLATSKGWMKAAPETSGLGGDQDGMDSLPAGYDDQDYQMRNSNKHMEDMVTQEAQLENLIRSVDMIANALRS